MKVIDVKTHQEFLEQYIRLRNQYCDLLLTSPVTLPETKVWLNNTDIEIRGLVQDNVLLGIGILYVNKNGEVTLIVREPNKGIGSRLLQILKTVARQRQLKHLWAWILLDNRSAQHVVEKHGFVKTGKSARGYQGKMILGVDYTLTISYSDHIQQAYGLKPEALEFPMMCVLSFVYLCNARCPNCPYTNSDIRSQYRDALIMPESIFKKIADECGEYGSYLRISGGGEPMLHPQATELLVYAKHQGAKVGLITNGSQFTENTLTTMIETGIDVIEFSVDAPDAETYRWVRPGLDWGRLHENVTATVNIRNRCHADTKVIVSVINQQGVDVQTAEYYWSKIVDNVQIRKYLTWGYNQNKSADPTPYLPPEEQIPCPWIFERLNIDSRGDVTLCGEDIAFQEKFVNVMERSIKDIWNGPEFTFFREKHLAKRGAEIPICSQCPDWQYRSWNHNYWKVLKTAEKKRQQASPLPDL